MRQMVKGIEKFRRVRRRRTFVPTAPDIEDESPGLHPSSEEECPILTIRVRQGHLFQGETPCESQALGYQCPIRETSAKHSDPQPLRKQRLLFLFGIALNEYNDLGHHPPIGSVGRSLSSTDDGSFRGTIHRPRKRRPFQAETRDQCSRALNGLSMLQ